MTAGTKNEYPKVIRKGKPENLPINGEYYEHTDGVISDLETLQEETNFNKNSIESSDEFSERKYLLTNELTRSDESLQNQELIPDSESEYDGWMMSKRRRVVINGVHFNHSFQSFFFYLLILSSLRWIIFLA